MKLYLMFRIAILFLFGIFSSPGFAEHEKEAHFYILYGIADYEDDLVSGLDPTGVVIRFVPATDNWFGYEGRLGLGISEGSDNIDVPPGPGKVEVDVQSIAGLYLNAHTDIGNAISVYGVAGYSWVRYDLEIDDTPLLDSEDETGFAYGFGLEIGKQNSTKLNLEFMQYLDKSDFDLSAISLGVSF